MKRIILPIVALLICNFSNAQICSKAQLPLNLQNGLVGYYPFCGNANDGSGNGNNGVVSGATLTIDRFGNTNSAYNFNGTNNYITIANVAANTFTSTFSISVWVKPAAGYGSGSSPNGTQNQIVSKWGFAGVNNASYSLGVDQAGIAFTGVHNGSVSSSVNSSPSTISINEWHHLVSTLSGGVLRLYVDNVLVKTISNSVNAQNSRYTLDIAREALGNYSYFKGVIDDIQIYNRALTPCEVNQIYTSTNTTFTTPSILTFNPLPTQISLCGSSIGLDAGSGFTSYLWNTGATSQTISATTAGEYRVTVTNASGCAASDTINVSLVKADILQSDQTVCVNTPLTLSVNSYASQSAKTIDFDNVGLAALDVTGGTAGSVSGVSGNGLSISRPTEVKTKDQTYGYGDYEVDAKTGTNTSNQYLSVLLPLNSWTNEAISIDSRPAGTDDVGWGVYVNSVRVAFANGTHPAGASTWYKMKIRVTPDSVKCWINSTLLYQGLNTTVPRNIGAVKLSTFSTSHFDNLKYIPYQTFSSVLWSTSATTSTISVTPTATTTYYATISDGISSCRDSVTLTVANIVGFAPLQDTVKVCGDSLVLDAGAGFASYNWSSGATTRIVTAKTSGRYIATVFNASGCSASDTSVVSIVKAKILQRDTTICKGSSITLAVDSSSLNKSSACLKSSLPAQLQNGLIAYYPFCGNANDGSGNGINGILFGAPTLVADRFGNSNAAYNFNGTNQYIQTGSISEPVTTKTISAWVKLSNISQMGGGVVAVQNFNSATFDAIVYNETNNGWGFGTDQFSRSIWSGVKETSSNWVMLTATYQNNSYKLYRNGILISTNTQSPIVNFETTSKLNIGLRHVGGQNSLLNGAIDDVFFYNRVLTSSEIMSLYNSSSSVNWSNGATSNTITVSPTATTKYFVTVTDGITTCRDSITVAVSDIGSYNPLQDTVKVCGDSLVLDAGAGYARYNWSNGATTRTISIKASGKYFVTVTNASGCSASDTSYVSIVKAKILQRDTTICKGSSITLAVDSIFSGSSPCDKSSLPLNLQNGLVAFYPFCGNANDASMNGFDGIVNGAKLTQDRFGKFNSAYSFDKKLFNYISLPLIRPLNNIKAASFSFWVKTRESNSSGAIFGHWRDTNGAVGDSAGVIIGTYSGNKIDFSNYSGIGGIKGSALNIDIWHHIVIVVDLNAQSQNSKFVIYQDGIIDKGINIDNFNNILGNATSSFIGRRNIDFSNFGDYFDGSIDDLFIYNRPLSQFEITQLYGNLSSVLWSTGATTSSITVNPTVKTTYRVTVTDGITTCRDSIVVDVSSSELKVTDPAAVCSPAVIDLTAAAVTTGSANGLTYTYWRDSTATQALTNPDKVSVSGIYYIVGKTSTGCTSAPTPVKVTVNPLPVATIVAPNQTAICDKSTISLTARGGTTYQWLLNGAAIAGATDSIYAAGQAGSYEVNVIAKGCTSKVAAPVNLTLIKAVVPKFSNSSTCIDVPVSFFNETDTASVNYVWNFGDGQTSTLSNPVYTYKKSGTFVVKLKVAPKLCSSLSDSITKNITVDVPPIGIKYPNVLAVKNKATPLSARFIANGYTYLWMPSTGLNNGAIQKPIFNASNEQLYRVRLTSAGGCITMDTVKVSVYDSSDIFVPKAFSPNKDGKNDLLQPFLVNILTLKFFKVYNRWGQLMFQSSDSRQGWDGMYNYKPQPLETYTWIAKGVDGNGTTIFRKGQTVLIR
jgi:gliding motility-associated-like protein